MNQNNEKPKFWGKRMSDSSPLIPCPLTTSMVPRAGLVLTDAVPGIPGKALGHTGGCGRPVAVTGLDPLLGKLAELTSTLRVS